MKAELVPAVFDYGDLANADVEMLEHAAEQIAETQSTARRTAAQAVIRLGEMLSEVHDLLAGKGRDGMFRPWVKERCGFGKDTAYKAISAYKTFAKCLSVDTFDAGALYLLSAESCPEEATKQAIKLAKKGEQITAKKAREIRKQYEPEEEEDGQDVSDDREPDENIFLSVSRIVCQWRQCASVSDKKRLAEHLRLMAESLENQNGINS